MIHPCSLKIHICKCQLTIKCPIQEVHQSNPGCFDPTPDLLVTCLWFSELCPRRSGCCDHRLPVCISPAVLSLVFAPRVWGCGGGLVRGDHRGRGFGLPKQINTNHVTEAKSIVLCTEVNVSVNVQRFWGRTLSTEHLRFCL